MLLLMCSNKVMRTGWHEIRLAGKGFKLKEDSTKVGQMAGERLDLFDRLSHGIHLCYRRRSATQ